MLCIISIYFKRTFRIPAGYGGRRFAGPFKLLIATPIAHHSLSRPLQILKPQGDSGSPVLQAKLTLEKLLPRGIAAGTVRGPSDNNGPGVIVNICGTGAAQRRGVPAQRDGEYPGTGIYRS
jgi:hypothetical protein